MLRDGICRAEKLALLGDAVSEGIAIPPPDSPSAAEVREMRNCLGIPEGSKVIGFAGRLTRDKGVDDLVACCRLLRSRGYPVCLLLLGDFEEGDPVSESTAAFLRSSAHVRWLGYVADARPYYSLMDVFVFPTRREGLGRVLLEAAAAGKPVVSTRNTGVIDVVQDGKTGILVSPADVDALARATANLLEDRELAARMGACARFLVERHFDNSVYLERLKTLLQSFAAPERVLAARQEG
jgi:glycosyltransferase involved in cell wall biosynthesis